MKVTIKFVADNDKFVNRVNLFTDESFPQLDEKGVEKSVEQFSKDAYALDLTLRKKCKEYRKFALKANGKLETGEIGMLLMGASMEITRTLKHAGEEREEGRGVYERDTYATTIESVTINPEEAMLSDLEKSIDKRKALAKMADTNPFGF